MLGFDKVSDTILLMSLIEDEVFFYFICEITFFFSFLLKVDVETKHVLVSNALKNFVFSVFLRCGVMEFWFKLKSYVGFLFFYNFSVF